MAAARLLVLHSCPEQLLAEDPFQRRPFAPIDLGS